MNFTRKHTATKVNYIQKQPRIVTDLSVITSTDIKKRVQERQGIISSPKINEITVPIEPISDNIQLPNVSTIAGKYRIEQIYISKHVQHFGAQIKSKYQLKDFYDSKKPVFIFGMYDNQDYNFVLNHSEHKVVFWCGSDAMSIDTRIKTIKNITHIVGSKFVSDDLTNAGINHLCIPITPTTLQLPLHPRGDNVYFYFNKNNPNFYGMHFIDKIKKETGLNIIMANYNTYTRKQLIEIYKSCFIGLRTTIHDGIPTTGCELGLMGRNIIHNGSQPNALPYSNVDDIIKLIKREYKYRKNDNSNIRKQMEEYLDIGDYWLDMDYINNLLISTLPKKIVVLITTHQRPDKLINLLSDIIKYRSVFNIFPIIAMDGFQSGYEKVHEFLKNKFGSGYIIFHSPEHGGKVKYWQLTSMLYGQAKMLYFQKNWRFDYIIQLPDDVRLSKDFFNESIKQYDVINDTKKVCLNLLNDGRVQTGWNTAKQYPINFGAYSFIHTGWVDMCFISTNKFMEDINWDVNSIILPPSHENQSSGVGKQISKRLIDKGNTIYLVKKSMVSHGIHKSQMHHEHRKTTPLIATFDE